MTGILILSAVACWLVLLFCVWMLLRSAHDGPRWDWMAWLALSAFGWLATVTTYMAMYGVSAARAGAPTDGRHLVWGRRVIAATTMLFFGTMIARWFFAGGHPPPFHGNHWIWVGSILLAWVLFRGRRKP